jgi:probable phosphoglycerate mutase
VARRLVVEADGGSRGNPGPAGFGALVRDADTGVLLAEVAEAIGTATNNVAEYRGLIAGLRAAHSVDPEAKVDVRMDSKLVVEQMSGRWKIKHPSMRPLALEAASVFPPGQVGYSWIPRERNVHADRLANEALDAAARGSTWEPPAAQPPVATPDGPVDVDEAEVEPAPQTALVGWADLGPPTTFVLLRHGETAHTAAKRFSGSGGDDPALSDAGRLQAERAGRRRARPRRRRGDRGIAAAPHPGNRKRGRRAARPRRPYGGRVRRDRVRQLGRPDLRRSPRALARAAPRLARLAVSRPAGR